MNGLYLYIQLEWFLRFYNEKDVSIIREPQNIYAAFNYLKLLTVQDFDILYTHFYATVEEFEKIQEDYSDINCNYLPSINKIISPAFFTSFKHFFILSWS